METRILPRYFVSNKAMRRTQQSFFLPEQKKKMRRRKRRKIKISKFNKIF